MPIILPPIPDPTDLVMQGEQLRISSVGRFGPAPSTCPMLPAPTIPHIWDSMVYDEDAFPPMNSFIEINRLSIRRFVDRLQIRENAGISTPCGEWIWNDWSPLLLTFIGPSVRWTVSGLTRDAVGAALGNCAVTILEVGRIAIGEGAIAAQTISDGSGNYSVAVPMNTAYQAVSYKPGSPDVAGISNNLLTLAQI